MVSSIFVLPDLGHALPVVLVGAAFVLALLAVVGFAARNRP